MLTKLQNTKRSQNPTGKNLSDENNKKWGNPNRKMDNNNENNAWKGWVGSKNPRKVDSKLTKPRKPTKDNPCSKKRRQEKEGKGREREGLFRKVQTEKEMVMWWSEILNLPVTKYERERERARGGARSWGSLLHKLPRRPRFEESFSIS
jgi:hypothetical protein